MIPAWHGEPLGLIPASWTCGNQTQPNPNFCSRWLLARLSFVGYWCSLFSFWAKKKDWSFSLNEWFCARDPMHCCPILAFSFIFLFPKQKSISVNQNNFFLAPVILSSVPACLPWVYMTLDTPHTCLPFLPVISKPREFKPFFGEESKQKREMPECSQRPKIRLFLAHAPLWSLFATSYLRHRRCMISWEEL